MKAVEPLDVGRVRGYGESRPCGHGKEGLAQEHRLKRTLVNGLNI